MYKRIVAALIIVMLAVVMPVGMMKAFGAEQVPEESPTPTVPDEAPPTTTSTTLSTADKLLEEIEQQQADLRIIEDKLDEVGERQDDQKDQANWLTAAVLIVMLVMFLGLVKVK